MCHSTKINTITRQNQHRTWNVNKIDLFSIIFRHTIVYFLVISKTPWQLGINQLTVADIISLRQKASHVELHDALLLLGYDEPCAETAMKLLLKSKMATHDNSPIDNSVSHNTTTDNPSQRC